MCVKFKLCFISVLNIKNILYFLRILDWNQCFKVLDYNGPWLFLPPLKASMPQSGTLNKGAGRSTLGARLSALQYAACLPTLQALSLQQHKSIPNTVSVHLSFSFSLTSKEGKERGKRKEFSH